MDTGLDSAVASSAAASSAAASSAEKSAVAPSLELRVNGVLAVYPSATSDDIKHFDVDVSKVTKVRPLVSKRSKDKHSIQDLIRVLKLICKLTEKFPELRSKELDFSWVSFCYYDPEKEYSPVCQNEQYKMVIIDSQMDSTRLAISEITTGKSAITEGFSEPYDKLLSFQRAFVLPGHQNSQWGRRRKLDQLKCDFFRRFIPEIADLCVRSGFKNISFKNMEIGESEWHVEESSPYDRVATELMLSVLSAVKAERITVISSDDSFVSQPPTIECDTRGGGVVKLNTMISLGSLFRYSPPEHSPKLDLSGVTELKLLNVSCKGLDRKADFSEDGFGRLLKTFPKLNKLHLEFSKGYSEIAVEFILFVMGNLDLFKSFEEIAIHSEITQEMIDLVAFLKESLPCLSLNELKQVEAPKSPGSPVASSSAALWSSSNAGADVGADADADAKVLAAATPAAPRAS